MMHGTVICSMKLDYTVYTVQCISFVSNDTINGSSLKQIGSVVKVYFVQGVRSFLGIIQSHYITITTQVYLKVPIMHCKNESKQFCSHADLLK